MNHSFFITEKENACPNWSQRGRTPYVPAETVHWKVTRCTPYSGEDISRNIYKRSCRCRYDEKPGCIQRWRWPRGDDPYHERYVDALQKVHVIYIKPKYVLMHWWRGFKKLAYAFKKKLMLVKNKLGFTRKIWPQNVLESLLRTSWIRNISLGRPYPPTRGVISLVLPSPTPTHTHAHAHAHACLWHSKDAYYISKSYHFQKSTTALESVSGIYWWKHR